MTALWKRRAQRAEERRAKSLTEEEAWAVLNERMRERVSYTPINPPRPDPRGRVRFIRPARSHIICGRCGQPALSEATPTILEHYTEAHGAAPRQMVLGRFEERCEVTR